MTLHQHMSENGIPADHIDLQLDGTLHRFGKEGPRDSKDEWYIGFENENWVYCTYGSWSSDEKFTYTSGSVSPEERLKYEQEVKERFKEYHTQRLKENQEAILRAKDLYEKTTLDEHPYLQNKKIQTLAPVLTDKIVVPYYNIDNEIQTLQFIDTNEKRFLKGSSTKGCFHPIGKVEDNVTIYIAEGYATGITINQATNKPVVVCGSMGNIDNVTVLLKFTYPRSKLVLCQDVGESADKHADEWKKKFQGTVYKPDSAVNGYDFNDLYCEKGIEAVKTALKCNPFKLYRQSDVETLFNKPIEWLIPNQITKNSITMIHAKGGVGKSRVLMEMMFALIERDVNVNTNTEYPKENSSIRWLKWQVPEIHKCLYIDTELQGHQINARMKDIVTRRKSVYKEEDFAFIIKQETDEYINFYDQATRDKVDMAIEEFDVIFIDNLQNALIDMDLGGESKENDPKYWFIFFQWMKRWTRQGKTFILAHHTGKSGSYRGTSRQEGDVDTLIKLSYPHEHKIEIQGECDIAFVYEMEKGRDIKFNMRQSFLAQNHARFTKFHGNWQFEYLDKVERKK